MKVLVIGSGGREHALAWKASKSDLVEKVFVAPGNAGTALEPGVINIDIGSSDIEALADFAGNEDIGLTIVGPEAPLVKGLVDHFMKKGLRCFGPTKEASQLEGSKSFTKDFLARHRIPTAAYRTFNEIEPATDYIRSKGTPIVVKADGLAAGKGVILAQTEKEAISAVRGMLSGDDFGDAGKTVVIEEFLRGEEASFIVMVDKKNILPLATSQDHKAVNNGDTGINTGGMGAYSPAPVVTPEIYDRIIKEVITPTVRGMEEEGYPYLGFLYAGLMIDDKGTPKVLEFNCRFGDPETQPILLRLKSDLVGLCIAALDQRLHEVSVEWDERPALGVVMASGGYPESYSKGHLITGLPDGEQEEFKVFHAGTKMLKDKIVTSGGRVLCVTTLGESVNGAKDKAYEIVKRIKWDNVYFRTDIGYRAVARERLHDGGEV